MRTRFDAELTRLHENLVEMGKLCEKSIQAAMNSLFNHDQQEAKDVHLIEQDINQLQRVVIGQCLKLLLEQQPVASDLRAISAGMQMSADLERIGDYAEDVADMTRFINNDELLSQTRLREMADTACRMVTDSVKAFTTDDAGLAKEIMARDDAVDADFARIRHFMADAITGGLAQDESFIDIMMISKYLERVADHAVNICEDVVYSVTGKMIKDSDLTEE